MIRIGVDVGGTFTDLVLWDDTDGRATVYKLPSTPADASQAAVEGIAEVARRAGTSPGEVAQVLHGTTVATNILIQYNGAKVGFITTAGFRDILHAARHKKPHAFSLTQELPWQSRPLVARRHRVAVRERIVPPEGEVLIPLDEAAVEEAARTLVESGVDAIAIGFLFSFLNREHERRAKEICTRVAPDLFVCTSSEVLSQFREFERFSTTAINAYVGPAVRRYLEHMSESLQALGIAELHLMNSWGGVVTAEGAAERPAALMMSGPVAGVLGGIWAGALSELSSVITLDVGGTSADIGVAPKGELRMKHILDSTVAGYHTAMPMADCDSIGAGGGSIAFVDEGGVLRVGPRSAGADPGPACYGRGGTEPTVTDAQLILGRLTPEGLLGGTVSLDWERALTAVRDRIALPLGISVEEAALGIVEIATDHMVRSIETNSVRRGFDPRDFSLVAIGGAGPFFGCEIAARMDIPLVVIPPYPGVTSALGLLTSGLVYEFGRTVLRGQEAPRPAELAAVYDELEREAHATMERDGIPLEKRQLVRIADCRYEGQGYELRVVCPDGAIDEGWVESVVERLHEAHEREYYRSSRDRPVQVVTARVRAIGGVPDLEWPELPKRRPAEPAGRRDVWFRLDGGAVKREAPFFVRDDLAPGQRVEGPVVIQQFESTTVVPPGFSVDVDARGNLLASPKGGAS